jgi:mono/diheme cytochrome c family protein
MWRSGGVCAAGILFLGALAACGGDGQAPEQHPASAPADARARGESIYSVRCAPCHGANGGGDGPAAAGITPKPRNFRDPDFWRGRPVDQLRLVVRQGKPGTLMPPFEGVLSPAEVDDVVGYVQGFRPAS